MIMMIWAMMIIIMKIMVMINMKKNEVEMEIKMMKVLAVYVIIDIITKLYIIIIWLLDNHDKMKGIQFK